jgi:hypothetical protein
LNTKRKIEDSVIFGDFPMNFDFAMNNNSIELGQFRYGQSLDILIQDPEQPLNQVKLEKMLRLTYEANGIKYEQSLTLPIEFCNV